MRGRVDQLGPQVVVRALDRALVDLAGFYRDVLAVQASAEVELVNDEMRDAVTGGQDSGTISGAPSRAVSAVWSSGCSWESRSASTRAR